MSKSGVEQAGQIQKEKRKQQSLRFADFIGTGSVMTVWQDRVKRGCCAACLFTVGLCRGFAFRFPKPKIMAKWLNVPYAPRRDITCWFAEDRTEELGEFGILVFIGSTTEIGETRAFAALIEIEGRKGTSRIGILDEGIANEVNSGRQNELLYCAFKAQDYRAAIVDGTMSTSDVLFIDTCII